MDRPWQIELFGWLRVVQTDRVITRFRTRKAAALLAYLAYFRHRSHPREQLVELLELEGISSAGLRRLSVELAVLRRQLEPPGVPPGAVLIATRTAIRLNPEACVTDVFGFEAALEAAEQAADPAERAQQLAAAARLYRGELLPGHFEEWILSERQRLAEAFLTALRELVRLLEERGDVSGALQWARRAVAADWLDEESHQRLIRLLLAIGQVEAAREHFEQAEHRLLQELGVGLSPEVRALIREAAPAKDRPPAVRAGMRGQRRSPASPRSDLLSASPVTSLAINGFTESGLPLEPAGTTARPSGNLPLRFTRFFGREREIAALVELLRGTSSPTPSRRLVTLTGPGGSGKTRLSLQAAQDLRDAYAGGVWFVSLRELSDPALIPEQILLALWLPRSAQREAMEQVVSFLSTAPCLLLLDNYEHLVERGAATVQRLLELVAHLVVLVTSRQRLGLEGEREFRVAPLPVPEEGVGGRVKGVGFGNGALVGPYTPPPTPHTLSQCPSVALFVDRAQAVRPEFQVTARNAAAVAELCQRLEGLPLAVELAAARASVLTPQQMLARLESTLPSGGTRFELLVGRQRTVDPRHRSLRATLDWSYQLLSPELQQCFAQLSIFRGGWTVAAAEAICRVGPALEYLEQLREASLVQAAETEGEMRFHLLETLREFGAEQLSGEDQEALARRHAHFFLALAETAEPELTRADQTLWLDRLERELDNVRTALAWSAETVVSGQWSVVSSDTDSGKGERVVDVAGLTTNHHPPTTAVELGLRLASALERFWQTRGHVKEGRAHLQRLLDQASAAAPTVVRAQALSTAGRLTSLQGNLESARALLSESLALWRRLEDRAGIATVFQHLGWMAVPPGDQTTARPLAEGSLAIRRELGEPRGIADALALAATVRLKDGDPSGRELLEESIAICRALGDQFGALRGLATLADWADLDTARRLHEEVLAAATELGDKPRIAWALFGLGQVAHVQEDFPAARGFFEQSLPLWRELDEKPGLIKTLAYLGYALKRQRDAAAAYRRFAERLAIAREANWPAAAAESLALMGAAAADLGRWDESAARCVESLKLCARGETWSPQIALKWAFLGLARGALERGDPARAARLLGAAEALLGLDIPARRREVDPVASAARARIGAAEFDTAWAEGRAMPVGQAIALALQEAPGTRQRVG